MKDLIIRLNNLWLIFSGVRYGNGVRVRGAPIIHRCKNASIVLGSGVVLQSSPRRYHAHMDSPVKLLADREGAVINVGDGSRINGACIHAVKSIHIGKRCLIAAGVQVLDSNAHELSMDRPEARIDSRDVGRPVVIEDDVWIGLNVVILPGTIVGAGSVIGANVVLSGTVPPKSIVKAAPYQLDLAARL